MTPAAYRDPWYKTTDAEREAEGRQIDDLARGESVPGAPGACAREGCHHLTLWHCAPEGGGRYPSHRTQPCQKCRCPHWTDEPGAAMPPFQGSLFELEAMP